MDERATTANVDRVPARSPSVAWQKVGGEVVLLEVSGRALMGLNGVGAWVWEAFDGQRSIGEVARQLAERCGEPESRVLADVEAFTRELVAKKCLALDG